MSAGIDNIANPSEESRSDSMLGVLSKLVEGTRSFFFLQKRDMTETL